jgi:SAM-dependent methyltransferase
MLERVRLPARPSVLEIGCGTGRLLAALRELAGEGIYTGVDAEPAMLRRLPGIEVSAGHAERLPLATGKFDLAYFSLAFHLLENQAAAAAESWRVLAAGGAIAIWTLTPEHVHGFHLNRCFPSLRDIDLARFTAPERWMAILAVAGFAPVIEQELVTMRTTTRRRLAHAVRARYISTLSLLPDSEFAVGAERLAREAAAAPRQKVTYRQRWCLIWGRK